MLLRAAKNVLLALLVVTACTIGANAAQPSSASTPLIQPSIVQPVGVPDERAVISLLSDVINWYRRGEVESQLVRVQPNLCFYLRIANWLRTDPESTPLDSNHT